jgi:hypothetical protein
MIAQKKNSKLIYDSDEAKHYQSHILKLLGKYLQSYHNN